MRIIDLNVNGVERFDNIDRVLQSEAFKQLDSIIRAQINGLENPNFKPPTGEELSYGQSFGPTSVVIGSDDPDIFATSLRGEYAHLLRALEANGAGHDTIEILERINKTSKRFRF